MKRTILLLIAAVGLFSGCSTEGANKLTWIGKTRTDLVAAFGKPTATLANNLGYILVFDTHVKRIRTFWVDKTGRIYHYDIEDRPSRGTPSLDIGGSAATLST